MKYVLIFTFCALAITATLGQTPLTYRQVIAVDSVTGKDDLLDRAREWFTACFTGSNEVIQVVDRNNGEFMCRGIMPYNSNVFERSSSTKGHISFDVKIYFKPGRFRYEFTNFRHEGTGGYEWASGSESNNKYPPVSFGLLTTDSLIPEERFDRKIDYRWQNKVWNDLKAVAGARTYDLVELLKKYMSRPAAVRKDNW